MTVFTQNPASIKTDTSNIIDENKTDNSNVDPAELAKFGAIADRWWDRTGEFGPLHDINPLRLNYINERAKLANKQVIDVGCGVGILTEGLAYRGAVATGIDMSEAPLAVAREHARGSGLEINYRQVTAEALAAEKPGQFEVVTCLEMLEHVPDPSSVIAACSRLVKPGGHVFFSTINRNPKSWLFAVVGAEYVLNMIPRGTHDYMRFIKPSELCGWCREEGLEVQDLSGMTYNPMTRQYKVNSDVGVNYLVHAIKL